MITQTLCPECSQIFKNKRKSKYCSQKCYFEHDKERLKELAIRVGKENADKISKSRVEGFANGSIVHPFLGKKMSKEHIENMVRTRVENGTFKGENNPMFGKNHTQESCEKMSKTRSNNWVAGKYNTIWQKGRIFSEKMQREIPYRSSWEREFIKYLDKKEDVVSFKEDSVALSYHDTLNKKRHYLPDFLIEYSDGRKELVEIKPKNFIDYEINKLKFKARQKVL